MTKLTLSNGTTLRCYIGDGFDGASGFYFSGKAHGEKPRIPKKDIPKVIAHLRRFAVKELRLREVEGGIHHVWKDDAPVPDVEPVYENSTDPYDAVYQIGRLGVELKAHTKALRTRKS